MYKSLKKSVKSIIPESILFQFEEILRWPVGLWYSGSKHQCLVCGKKLSGFIVLKNGDYICPFCGSLPRTRRLWKFLFEDLKVKGKVLHFSPSRSLYRRLKKIKTIDYVSTDFENEFLADQKYDITNLDIEDNQFDFIICYHILEHIENDVIAMKELFRVLKPGGTVIIQTPFKEGDIYENEAIKTPEARKIHFDQEDHVRIYSVEGLKKRLENTGFLLKVNTFKADDFYGLREGENVFFAEKPTS
jgi:SAM-dependent methyltransferase